MGSDSTSRRRFFTLFASARKSSAMAKHYPETTGPWRNYVSILRYRIPVTSDAGVVSSAKSTE